MFEVNQIVYWDGPDGLEDRGIFKGISSGDDNFAIVDWPSEEIKVELPLKDLRTQSVLISKIQRTRLDSTKIALTGKNIAALLRHAGYGVPSDATIQFKVPSGGDWSGMSVDVDAHAPIIVEWDGAE